VGYWSLDVLEVFPSPKILMIEAQKKKEVILQNVVKGHENLNYVISLLSSADGGKKLFLESETASHIVEKEDEVPGLYTLETCTLDNILESLRFPLPDFLKLDVQGHELEVLKGAEKALPHAEVCLLEISFLDLGDKGPLLAEMISFMNENNFQAYDISQFMRRPFDKALYQIDMFFVRKDSQLVHSKRWN
jgi:FkbM family methyltransferase